MKNRYIYSIVLLILSCGLLASCAEEAVYILPDYFEGKVEVIYNDSSADARPLTYKDGKRVFKIPPSGVLKTNAEYVRTARYASDYFYTKADGSLQPLKISGHIMKCKSCLPIRDSGTISIDYSKRYTIKGKDKLKAESFVISFNHKTTI